MRLRVGGLEPSHKNYQKGIYMSLISTNRPGCGLLSKTLYRSFCIVHQRRSSGGIPCTTRTKLHGFSSKIPMQPGTYISCHGMKLLHVVNACKILRYCTEFLRRYGGGDGWGALRLPAPIRQSPHLPYSPWFGRPISLKMRRIKEGQAFKHLQRRTERDYPSLYNLLKEEVYGYVVIHPTCDPLQFGEGRNHCSRSL